MAPYDGALLRSWLAEGTPAGLGAVAPDAADTDDAAAALRARRGDARPRRLLVDQHVPLRDVMAAPGHVLPSTLLLFVLPRGSAARQRFLDGLL